jgi:Copper type II ascorbate-dependent monooxygenase, N-terminal domain/Copper type II ascorbate-dependent monooxygenase, C-terminal domain
MRRLWLGNVVFGVLAACGDDAQPSARPDAGAPGDASADAAAPSDAAAPLDAGPSDALPCDVARVVAEHCGSCHGETPAFGAPVPLADALDFQAAAKLSSGDLVAAALARLDDPRAPMPPTSQPAMPEADVRTLKEWLRAGAKGTTSVCDPADAGADAGAPLPPCDGDSYELRAHQNPAAADDEPFAVPVKDDRYECFVFDVPWTGKRHGLRFDALIDDARVVHHWLVYGAGPGEFKDGDVFDCSGRHPDAQLLAGWAPGRGATVMPDDVGLQLPEQGKGHFVLEIHYNNSAGHTDVKDRSGARLCASEDLRKNEAAVHWLGTESISVPAGGAGTAVGTCSPRDKATILNTWPHMHQLGRHMTTVITRASGGQEVLVDKPFSFADQVSYDLSVQVGPGDKLRTTCSFTSDRSEETRFGSGSESEMCYNFVLAYPAGALTSAFGFSLTGAKSTCIDAL